MTTLGYSALLVFSTLISAVSQVLLKKSANRNFDSRMKEYLNPLVITAYVIFVAATFLTIWSYRGVDISHGAMLETSGYIFVFLFDLLIFRETVNAKKILAIGLIILGIIIATT